MWVIQMLAILWLVFALGRLLVVPLLESKMGMSSVFLWDAVWEHALDFELDVWWDSVSACWSAAWLD